MFLFCPGTTANRQQLTINNKTVTNNLGFTLIELIITIMIVAILFGIGIAYFNASNSANTLRNAADKVKSDLRLTQSGALSGVSHCLPLDGLRGHYLRATINIYYSSGEWCGSQTGGSYNFGKQTIALPAPIRISSYSCTDPINADSVVFAPKTGDLVGGNPEGPGSVGCLNGFSLTLTNGSQSRTIRVNSFGNIYE